MKQRFFILSLIFTFHCVHCSEDHSEHESKQSAHSNATRVTHSSQTSHRSGIIQISFTQDHLHNSQLTDDDKEIILFIALQKILQTNQKATQLVETLLDRLPSQKRRSRRSSRHRSQDELSPSSYHHSRQKHRTNKPKTLQQHPYPAQTLRPLPALAATQYRNSPPTHVRRAHQPHASTPPAGYPSQHYTPHPAHQLSQTHHARNNPLDGHEASSSPFQKTIYHQQQ